LQYSAPILFAIGPAFTDVHAPCFTVRTRYCSTCLATSTFLHVLAL